MSNLFIKDVLMESSNIVEVLNEDYGDMIDSFISYAERRLTGYSVKEVDVLAKKAKAVDNEVDKRATLTRIEEAIKSAKEKLSNSKLTEDQRKDIRLQIQVLGELKAKVNSFKVAEDHSPEAKERRKINLDEL